MHLSRPTLLQDIQIVFDIEIRGPFIVPFTNPKAVVIGRVLQNRYFRSAALADITVAPLRTFTVRPPRPYMRFSGGARQLALVCLQAV